MSNEQPARSFSMSRDDAIYWLGLAVFPTGLFVVTDHAIYGWALIVAGVGLLGWAARAHAPRTSPRTAAFIVAVILTWGAVGYDAYQGRSLHNTEYTFDRAKTVFSDNYNYTIVTDKKFYNERIVVDGKRFENCSFTNVTFVYNGTAPAAFSNNDLYGTRLFTSENQSIMHALILIYGLGIPSTSILNLPPGTHLAPPKNAGPESSP